MSANGEALCSRCDEVIGTVVTEGDRATIRLSTTSHGTDLPISCPRFGRSSSTSVSEPTDD